MTQQEFFKEWSEKYKKSFGKFKLFIQQYFNNFNLYYDEDSNSIRMVSTCNHSIDEELPFEMLSGIINKFFREYDILFVAPTYSEFGWGFCVMDILENERFMDYMEHRIENTDKAMQKAILKSAEILENNL